jgi:hypothetical protein
LRRLRFSRNAAESRALRAAHFAALPGLCMVENSKHAGQRPATAVVMPGLVPGIHVLCAGQDKNVDGRDKPGHDGFKSRRVLALGIPLWQGSRAFFECICRTRPLP